MSRGEEIPGLTVTLERLVYHHDAQLPADRPHAFVYYLTVRNFSQEPVILRGRKWVLRAADGSTEVVEGDRIVGETPRLEPGDTFSYNSYHTIASDTDASGSLHGTTEDGRAFFLRVPDFRMEIPG